MKHLNSSAFKYDGKQLLVLDQQKLPQVSEWIPCTTVDKLVELIQRLAIRGAPLIGISAAALLGYLAEQGMSRDDLLKSAATLRAARPTAVNLMHCIDKMTDTIKQEPFNSQVIIAQAEALFDEDVALCQAIAKQGATVIDHNEQILTHCNTGGLATAGMGTALGVIFQAHNDGKNIHVYVDETRPLLQGARLNAWELKQAEIPYTLLCDNMAATLMQQKKVTKILVGADRIAANGDFANKIGTYGLAVLAYFHNIPFYVVAPQTTVDLECPNRDAIHIEQRKPEEVTGFTGSTGTVTWAPKDAPVYNPAFDVTPANLITGWILDSGVYTDFSHYVFQKTR